MGPRTWPVDWDDQRQGVHCPKCLSGRGDEDESGGVRFFAGSFGDGYLQRRAPQPGYTVVAFHLRHAADLTDLTDEESDGFWRDVRAVASALEKEFEPCHINYQVLGNGVPHVHAHIILRYLDDPAPCMPLVPWEPHPVDDDELARRVQSLRDALLGG